MAHDIFYSVGKQLVKMGKSDIIRLYKGSEST